MIITNTESMSLFDMKVGQHQVDVEFSICATPHIFD